MAKITESESEPDNQHPESDTHYPNVIKFVGRVWYDQEFQELFRDDPDTAMEEFGLNENEKKIARDGREMVRLVSREVQSYKEDLPEDW